MGAPKCLHRWRLMGPAPDHRGVPCVLWRCDKCEKEWETFEDCEPQSRGAVVIR